MDRLIREPHGIVLVTGPTGSGKTTTLYAALSRLPRGSLNMMTVEDPIEYALDGVGQTQVNPKIELTFARALRAILRQDPDIIMIGEIRDLETAQIAVQASLTGHLVLATLHTNDAASAVTRLADMGVEPYLLASSLLGVLAQRLVRTLCPACRARRRADRRRGGVARRTGTRRRRRRCTRRVGLRRVQQDRLSRPHGRLRAPRRRRRDPAADPRSRAGDRAARRGGARRHDAAAARRRALARRRRDVARRARSRHARSVIRVTARKPDGSVPVRSRRRAGQAAARPDRRGNPAPGPRPVARRRTVSDRDRCRRRASGGHGVRERLRLPPDAGRAGDPPARHARALRHAARPGAGRGRRAGRRRARATSCSRRCAPKSPRANRSPARSGAGRARSAISIAGWSASAPKRAGWPKCSNGWPIISRRARR